MQEEFSAELELVNDYHFRIGFDDGGLPEVQADEPIPLGEGKYPNPVHYISAAIGNCLCASLVLCLRKVHSEPLSIKATVRTKLGRNEKGRLRITDMNVTIYPEVEDQAKLEKCISIFQDFCIVTAAVREGIDIGVSVEPKGSGIK